jgi:hypothetical protein
VGRRYSVRTSRPHDEVETVEEVNGFRSLPCIGGIVNLDLICQTGPSGREPYIRDIHPRRQEMIVDETIGVETMERSSSRTAVTKQWNISGTGSIPIEGFTVGVSGGYGETMTEEQARERSKKLSHITEVQHVHHVLTSYHLGTDKACMTIQPRPFEGEHWEMLKGYRLVEGIQDFFLIVNVPNDVEVLKIRACLNLGWRGSVRKSSLVKTRPPSERIRDRAFVEHMLGEDDFGEYVIIDTDKLMELGLERCNSWLADIRFLYLEKSMADLTTYLTNWRETHGTFSEIRKWINENLTENHLLSAYFCTEAEIPIKDYDIMEFIPSPAMTSEPSFEDIIVPTEPFFPDKSGFENLGRLNVANSMMFKAITSSSNVPIEKRIPLEQSSYFRSVVFSDFMMIPRVQMAIKDALSKSTKKKKKIPLKKRPKPKLKKRPPKIRR